MYPAFMSFKSLDSGDAAGTGYWLTYWIVWSCMTVLEVFEAVALYIPFYYELKLALVIWLIHPQSKGAEVCFKQFVQPMLKKHEKDIDDGLTHLQVRSSVAPPLLNARPQVLRSPAAALFAGENGGAVVNIAQKGRSGWLRVSIVDRSSRRGCIHRSRRGPAATRWWWGWS